MFPYTILTLILVGILILIIAYFGNKYDGSSENDPIEINNNLTDDNGAIDSSVYDTCETVKDVCPVECVKKVSKGESLCCEIMGKIYGSKFISMRPDWLKNPETGRNLELDCYNEDLKIAVEYNGIQHYAFPNYFHKSEKEFEDQKKRDKIKCDTCKKKGVFLITVPYTVTHDKIHDYITSHLPKKVRQRLIDEKTLEDISK